MKCIIIADKHKKRSKSKGWVGLYKINKNTLLINNQINTLRSVFPNIKIIYVYGFDHKKVEDFFDNYNNKNVIPVYNKMYEECGDVFSLSKAKMFIDQDTLVLGGDMILKPSMFKDFQPKTSLVYLNQKTPNELGCTVNKEGKVEHICYDLENYITNLFYFNRADSDIMRAIVSRKAFRNYFLFEIINMMTERGVRFDAQIVNKKNLFETIN